MTILATNERTARAPSLVLTSKATKLETLIAQWHAEKVAMKASCRASDAAFDAVKAEVPVPALIRHSKAAHADGIEKPHPDFPKPDAIHSMLIRRALDAIKPQTVTKTETERGMELVYLAKPIPLTDAQIAQRGRLQQRLEAATAYEAAFAAKLKERGYNGKHHDEIIDRHSRAMWRIELKIVAHKCADAAELKTKIEFFTELPGLDDFYDHMDWVRAIFAETVKVLGRGMH